MTTAWAPLVQLVLAAALALSIARVNSQLVLDDVADDDELMQVRRAQSCRRADWHGGACSN